MSRSLESLLAEFVERRERGEGLTPAEFAAEHGGDARQVEALERALARVVATEDLFPEALPPDRVGPWRLVAPIGGGATGRVYRAVHVDRPGDPPRALKLLAPAAAVDERAVARMRREGALLARLDHPAVVRVRDVGESSHGPYIVMDLVEGRTLAELLEDARRTGRDAPLDLARDAASREERWRAVCSFGAVLADGLAAAHAAGVLHRDVKPSNVIVEPDGAPVLVDFGLGADQGSHSLTGTGDLLGTPAYMCPEQARGERADERADVWSVGAVMWELCTLAPPVGGDGPLEVLATLRRRRPRKLRGAGVPAPLARVVDRALAHRPTRRTPSARDLAQDLARCAQGERPIARDASAVELLEDALRARPRIAWAVGAALALVAAVAVGVSVQRGARDAPSAAAAIAAARLAGTHAWLERDDDALRRAAQGLAGRAPEAAALLRELAAGSVAPASSDDSPPGWAALRSGAAALLEGDASRALGPLRVAAQELGDWSLPSVLLGEAAREVGELELCEREWTAATRLGVESPHLARRLGKVRRDRGDVDGAVRSFRRAVALGGDDWRNHAELARALVAVGSGDPPTGEAGAAAVRARLEEALAAADAALSRCAAPPRVLRNVKAAILDQLGRRAEAREVYRRVVEDEPDHFASRFNLAYSYDLDCLLAEARDAYRAALEVRSDSVEAHVALAKIATGSDCATCERCRAAVDREPDLVDPAAASAHLRAALAADDGARSWLPGYAVDLAVRAGCEADLLVEIERLLERRPEVDEGTVRLERAARRLRDALE